VEDAYPKTFRITLKLARVEVSPKGGGISSATKRISLPKDLTFMLKFSRVEVVEISELFPDLIL
jgi:hypothetical protein